MPTRNSKACFSLILLKLLTLSFFLFGFVVWLGRPINSSRKTSFIFLTKKDRQLIKLLCRVGRKINDVRSPSIQFFSGKLHQVYYELTSFGFKINLFIFLLSILLSKIYNKFIILPIFSTSDAVFGSFFSS